MNTSFFRALPATALLLALAACPPTYPKCESDSHCKDKGEVCVVGKCQECATDVQCKSGFVCEANKCIPKPECRADSDCRAGQKCKEQKCVTWECEDDAACGPGKKCQGNRCIVPPCAGDADCAAGETCRAGVCQKPPPVDETPTSQCDFTPIRFGFNDYLLDAATRERLAALAKCITAENRRIILEGHADERGTEEYNLQLSNKRADSVKQYLVDLRVREDLLDTVGYGENRPVDEDHGEAAWSKNRRVEFVRK
jgi:peptidoglycan-associated lipoprotein